MNSNIKNKSEVLSSETIYRSKYFHIDKETIKRNGRTFTKDILRRTSTVIVLPVNHKDEIYLVSQFRDSYQKVMLETVAGHIEIGDSPLESAKKELKEETGLTAKIWNLISKIHTSANINDDVYVFYAADLTEGEQDMDEDEDIEVVKIPFGKALEKIVSEEINVSSNIASILLLDKLRLEGKI